MSLRVVGLALRVSVVGLALVALAPVHAQAQGQIAVGQSMVSQLTPQSPVTNDGRRYGLWTFMGAAGQYVQIDMSSSFDNYLFLQDQNGNELGRDDDGGDTGMDARIRHTLPYTGMYRILAASYSTSGTTYGQYTLSLTGQGGFVGQPVAVGGQIALGQSLQGQLTPGSMVLSGRPYNLYTFYGNAGQQIQIDMFAPPNTIDPYLTFQDQNGNNLQTNDDGGGYPNARINYTLPYAGMYRILAMSFRTSGVMHGMYTLTLSGQGGMMAQPMVQPMVQPMANPQGIVGTIMAGQQAQGVLTQGPTEARWEGRPYQAYQFQCAAGQSFQMDILSTWDNYAVVFDPMGTAVARDDDTGEGLNARINYTCQLTGVYRLGVATYTSSTTPGAYTMQVASTGGPAVQPMVQPMPQPVPQPVEPAGVTLPQPSITGGIVPPGQVASIAFGQMMQGRLEEGDQTMNDGTFADVWTFQGSGGQTITIDLRSDEFDAYAQLLNASGDRLAEDDDGGGNLNSRITFTLPATGQYQIVVNNFGDSRRTGVYTVWLH